MSEHKGEIWFLWLTLGILEWLDPTKPQSYTKIGLKFWYCQMFSLNISSFPLSQAATWSACYAGYICYPIICWCQVINVAKSPPDEQQRLGQNVIRQKRCSYPPSWQIGLLLLESQNMWQCHSNTRLQQPSTLTCVMCHENSGCSLKVAHSALIHCACLLRLLVTSYNCFCNYIDNK